MTPEGDIVIDRYMSAMTTKLIELSDRMGRKIVMDEEGLKQEVAKCDANGNLQHRKYIRTSTRILMENAPIQYS